jgi:phospholipase/carboxylesterase
VPHPVVVALHGHGDHPHDLPDALAPALPDGWNVHDPRGTHGSAQAPSWFDADDPAAPLDTQIVDAAATLDRLVHQLVADQPVVIVGYSQGAALAATWLLSHPRPTPVLGVALIAGFLPPVDPDHLTPSAAAGATVAMVHGDNDDTVPLPLGRSLARLLERNGATVAWHEVDGGHNLDPALVAPVGSWLAALAHLGA